jgi:protease-4
MTTPFSPPPGQGPIDPRGAFYPPPPPGQPNQAPPAGAPGGWQPPMMPPAGPPAWFPPPPRRKRSHALRTLFTVLGVIVLLVSVLLNLALIAHDAVSNGLGAAGVRETTLISGDAHQKVALIPIVNEMILESNAQLLDKMLEAAEKDSTVKAIVLQIDSPGGAVTPSDEMHQRIVDFKIHKPGVPVVVSMGSLCASGGYYAASAADYLFAEPTTITGSIGVLMPRYNFARLADKYGVEDTSIHATGSPYKTAGSPLKPPTTQETEYLVGLIDADFTEFKKVVVAGRGPRLTQPIADIANGKAYTAAEALKLGLVDAIGYPTDAANYAASMAKLTKMTLVKYDAPPTLLELFSSSAASLPPPRSNAGVQVNGIQINSAALDSLLTPRLLYMWRGE